MKRKLPAISHQEGKILNSILVVFLLLSGGLLFSLAFGQHVFPQSSDLIPIELQGHKRLLVIAPHCDDETLGAGGAIQEAVQSGMEVKVVIETNGDGYLFATMEDFKRLYPRAQDFIRMGNLRQEESLKALQSMGVPEDQVLFLSYPDRGTPALWNVYWSSSKPYRSPYSDSTQSPYSRTYNPESVYAGEDLLNDLVSIIKSYQPDLVIYPHPDDVHPDHWGLSAFTRLAFATVKRNIPGYQPDEFAYLVHRPDYPYPKGLRPSQSLLPPVALFNLDRLWYQLGLGPQAITGKQKAVMMYRSQLPLLRSLMESFVRQNELFTKPQGGKLVPMVDGEPTDPRSWRDSSGNPIQPIVLDPVKDFVTRDLLGSADLTEVDAALYNGDTLALCGGVRVRTSPTLIYSLRILAVGSQGVVHHTARSHFNSGGSRPVQRMRKYFCDQVKLADLGDPWIIFLGADVEEVGTGIIDQTAWQYVEMDN
jgi:LmbE family N-acetylglucosaminyl deacetylase